MPNDQRSRYKRAFFAGLATLLPTILTVVVLVFCWNFISENIAKPLNTFFEKALQTVPVKEWYWKGLWQLKDYELDEVTAEQGDDTLAFSDRVDQHVPGWLGFVLALVLVFVVGFLFKGYLGRQFLRFLERWIQRLPVIKVIYPYAKQLTEFFFEEKKKIAYETAVAVEYPRKGIYSIGFVTSEGLKDVTEVVGQDMVSIFIPSSPTPITGYTILVPKADVLQLNMTADETLRFTITAGVILPPSQLPPLSLKTRRLDKPSK